MIEAKTLLHPLTGLPRSREAGLALRAAAVGPARGVSETALAPATRDLSAADQLNALMRQIVRPRAAMNWLAPQVATMTPQRIEMILRGALSGDYTQTWQLFDLMEDTWPRLLKNLNEVKRAVQKMEFKVAAWAEEEEAPSASAVEKAQFVSRVIRRMRPSPAAEENGFHATVYDILDAWAKGVSVLEILWDQTSDGIVPRATTWVNPGNYGWAADGSLGLNFTDRLNDTTSGRLGSAGPAQSLANMFGGLRRGQFVTPFIENKFLVAIAKAKTGHASVAALLRPLAWWWCAMNFSSEWLLNFAQIFGLPIRIGKYDPAQPGLFEKVCDFLERMGSTSWAALPLGSDIELHEASKGGQNNATPQGDLIDRADRQCDLLVLGQTLTTDVRDSGSRSLGEVHAQVRDDVIQAAADFAADVLNQQLVPALLQLNYGSDDEAPEFRAAPKKAEDKKANADRFAVLAGIGVKIPVGFIRENQEIPEPVGDEETVGGVLPSAQALGTDGKPVADPADPDFNTEDTESTEEAKKAMMKATQEGVHAHAHDAATDALLASVTGVEARWLGGLRPYYRELIAMAANARDDAEFGVKLQAAVDQSVRRFPDFLGKMDVQFLADRLEGVMGAACVNGAVNGYLKRLPAKAGTTNRGGMA